LSIKAAFPALKVQGAGLTAAAARYASMPVVPVKAGTGGGPPPPPSLSLYRGPTASFIRGFPRAAKTAAARTARIHRYNL
jgi:hypothetical protein